MSKIWYCRNCGYEVAGRGRCHECKERLIASPLPELVAGEEDDEVGYRLSSWDKETRGRLIEALIDAEILHRFEEEELVVAIEDEERTDDLIADITTHAPAEVEPEPVPANEAVLDEAIDRLYDAAKRLQVDPTDMVADADIGEASASVFLSDVFSGADAATWAAVGRVTRRLLAALGAEEALEDDIRTQSSVLVKLLEPIVEPEEDEEDDDLDLDAEDLDDVEVAAVAEGEDLDDVEVTAAAEGDATEPAEAEVAQIDEDSHLLGTLDPVSWDEDDEAEADETEDRADDDESEESPAPALLGGGVETVYELPEWLPEQRAELSLYLEQAGITYAWDGGDLVVPEDKEEEVEVLFDNIHGVPGRDDDGEARYRALEELFAAADRLANDPDDEDRAAELVDAFVEADGPSPIGIDDAQWWQIRSRGRTLTEAIESDSNPDILFTEARELRNLLRPLV